MGPQRIHFSVAEVSSEEDGYSAVELLNPGPESKGWRSAQYCIFPQELILQLDNRSSIDRVQVMMHGSMVTSALELYLGDVSPDATVNLRNALFIPLGKIEWSKSEKGCEGGRQLKTIEFGRGNGLRGTFLKLVLKRNHISRKNEYNQVSVLGVNIFGTPLTVGDSEVRRRPNHEDLAFLMYTDPAIVELIHKLEDRRMAALDTGREEYAKKLKRTITELEARGIDVGVLLAQKRMAVEKGDFEKAKAKKAEAEDLSAEIYVQHNIATLLELSGPLSANDERRKDGLPPASKHKVKPRSRSPSTEVKTEPRPATPPPPPPRYKTPSPIPMATPSPRPIYVDDREIRPAKLEESERPAKIREEQEEDDIEFTSQERKDLQVAIDVFGAKTIKNAINNKKPGVKEEACGVIKEQIQAYQKEGAEHRPPVMLRGSTQIIARLIRDKIWAIYCLALELHAIIINEFIVQHKLPSKEIESSAVKFYKELIIRSGDTMERIQDKAEDAIKLMLQNQTIRDSGKLQELIIPPLQVKEAPKQSLSKTELVWFMVNDLKIAGTPPTTVKALADFGFSAVTHSLSPVRHLGEAIMVKLYELEPKTVKSVMPKENDKTWKNHIPVRKLCAKFGLPY